MFCPEGSTALPSSNHRICLLGEAEGLVFIITQDCCKDGVSTGITSRLGGVPFLYQVVFVHWPGMRFRDNAHCCYPKGLSTLSRNEGAIGG